MRRCSCGCSGGGGSLLGFRLSLFLSSNGPINAQVAAMNAAPQEYRKTLLGNSLKTCKLQKVGSQDGQPESYKLMISAMSPDLILGIPAVAEKAEAVA